MIDKQSRIIDADAFKKYIDCGHLRSPTEICFSELDVIRMIDKQPTVDAKPVCHARWIWADMGTLEYPNWEAVCSNCGYMIGDNMNTKNSTPCCPGCGAYMYGGANE